MSSFQKISSVVGDGTSLIKTNDEHGLVFGFGMVSLRKNGSGEYEPYYDSGELLSTGTRRVDHIPEAALLKSSLEYARGGRVAGDEHLTAAQAQLLKAAESIEDDDTRAAAIEIVQKAQERAVEKRGTVPFLFPLLSDVAEALGISTQRTGLLVGALPDPDIYGKYQNGEYTGFSIGGMRIEDKVVSDG